jgi:hypothetical protein
MDAEPEPEPQAAEGTAEEGVPPVEAEAEAEPEAEGEAEEEPEQPAAAAQADDGMESGFQALEMVTTDDTEPAPPEVLEQLGEAAEGLAGDEAAQLGQWLSARLAVESIPVVLKTLQLVGLMLDAAADAGNEELREAFSTHATDAVTAALGFDQVDPDHGERPAQLIRKVAAGVLGKLGGEAASSAAAADDAADGEPRPRGTVVGLYGDQSADDLFELALQRRRQKAAGGSPSASAEEKKPEVKAKFTFASGLKNLANDLIDSTTLSTKSWRWTPPAMGAPAEGGDAAEAVSHFISTRHSADSLTVLFDGSELKQWTHDPNEAEKDYAFALPGGLSGMVTVTRLAANKYEYSLDVPGEVMDLAEHWLTATVELDSIFIRKATVENKESADAYILYEVTTILRDRPEGPGHVTHKRFSEFDQLHKLVRSSFSAKLNKSKEFVMPTKPKKTLMKRFDEASVQKRRLELELYLQELIRIPAIGSNPDVLRFLNVPIGGSDAAAGGGGAGAGGGGNSEERLAEVAAMVEASSTDDTHKAPPETLAGLARLAMAADDAMSKHLCESLASRLDSDSIAVKVKALNLLSTLLTRGSPSFCSAAVEACAPLVEQCCSFDREDPEHGTKPAELIRASASKIRGTLKVVVAAASRQEDTQATGDGVVEVGAAGDVLPPDVIQHMEAATADSEAPAPPAAIAALSAVLTSAGGMGLGGAGKTNVPQVQAMGDYLGKRLGGGDATAPKLKTLLLLETLLPAAPQEAKGLLDTHCRQAAMSCLHWNKIDAKHGDRPAALVREKAKAVLALLDAAERGV